MRVWPLFAVSGSLIYIYRVYLLTYLLTYLGRDAHDELRTQVSELMLCVPGEQGDVVQVK